MGTENIRNSKTRIRTFFKELINIYKSKNYKEEIVQLKYAKSRIPTFELRFVKQGEDCKYYRILLEENSLI